MNFSMNFISGLLKSSKKKVLFVVVDKLTKYSRFMALNHTYTAANVAQVFIEEIYKVHSLPNNIINDRDLIFISSF